MAKNEDRRVSRRDRGANATMFAAAVVACACWLAAGCGFGTAGIAAASSGGGGGANAPSSASGLVVLNPKVSPATIRFSVQDAESDEVFVEFFWSLGAEGEERKLTRLDRSNPVSFRGSAAGVVREVGWDFASEPGIATTALTSGVVLTARVTGGADQSTVVDLGNDAPTVAAVQPAGEVSGVVPFALSVSDSSSDLVSIRIEWREVGSGQAWTSARPAGLDASAVTPSEALVNVTAMPAPGTEELFFWDSEFDLAGLEREVEFRFTPADPLGDGVSTLLSPVRVDNNQSPLAQVNEASVLAGADRSRGIALPVTVFDAESDTVDVLLQWRRESDPGFVDLGTESPAELRRLMLDEDFVREKQICRPGRLFVGGKGQMVGGQEIRTDEFALDSSRLLPNGVVGRQIEILRPAGGAPVRVSDDWSSQPFLRPIAVLPIGSGAEAVVLDDIGGSARVAVVEVATGSIVAELAATLEGTPTAMCWSTTRANLIVATESIPGWRVYDVPLVPHASTPPAQVASAPAGSAPGPIRGIVSEARRLALATSGDEVIRIDWDEPAGSKTTTLLRGLQEPWGIVRDPHDPQRVLVAERSFGAKPGRIASWDLRQRLPIAVLPVSESVPRPSAMVLDATNRRLHVVFEPASSGRLLKTFSLGSSVPAEQITLPDGAEAIGVGPTVGAAWVVVDPAARVFVARGGAAHRRVVTGYDPAAMLLSLDREVVGVGGTFSWQLRIGDGRSLATTPTGRTELFLWDSRQASGVGDVVLRVFAIDSEFGLASQTVTGFSVRSDGFAASEFLPSSTLNVRVMSDLDGDGDLDAVIGSDLVRQVSPREFGSTPIIVGVGDAVDYDGDSRNDLIQYGANVGVWLQDAGGGFVSAAETFAITADAAADVDGDGLVDFVEFGPPSRIYRGQPGGGVAAAIEVAVGLNVSNVKQVSLVDIHGDGRLDLLVLLRDSLRAGGDRGVRVLAFEQQSDGQFSQSAETIYAAPFDSGANRVFYEDLDQDGSVDLVLSHRTFAGTLVEFIPAHVTIVRRVAGANVTAMFDRSSLGLEAATIRDVDGDGLLDVVGRDQMTGLKQLASGDWINFAPDLESPAFVAPTPFRMDIDGDGLSDSIVNGAPAYRASRGVGASFSSASGVFLDVSGDGLLDLIDAVQGSVGSGGGGNPTVTVGAYLQTGAFSFPGVADDSRTIFNGDSPPVIYIRGGDIDGDGVANPLIYALGEGARVYFTLGAPSPVLSFTGQLIQFSPGAIATADFDRDGALDVVASRSSSVGTSVPGWNRLWLRKQVRGAGYGGLADLAFDQTAEIDLVGTPFNVGLAEVTFGDANADGLLDVVAAAGDGRLFVFLQDSNGGIELSPVIVGVADSAVGVRVLDLDGDGFDDLLDATPAGIDVYYGDGAGVPATATSIPFAFHVEDVDKDGLPDLIEQGAGTRFHRQLNPRRFLAFPTLAPIDPMAGLGLDIDLDGEVDALIQK